MRSGPEWFIVLETIGILSFAFNAMIVAKAKGLSPMGVFICAAVTGLGGGTLRDLLLGPAALPFFWIAFPFYIVAIFFLSLAYAHSETVRELISKRVLAIKDTAETAAMASLAALGAAKAYTILAPGVQPGVLGATQLIILCAFFGAMTASFGGIIRDILLNEFPAALKPDSGLIELLFVGSLAVVLLRMADIPQPWALLVGFAAIVILRTWRLASNAKPA